MAQPLQSLNSLSANPLLDVNNLLPRLRRASGDADSRRIKRRLRIVAKGQHIQQNLDVALRLHETAHDAVDGVQGAVRGVGDHCRDDGVVGAFARGEHVGVVGAEVEVCAAVLESEAATCGDDARAEAGVVAVDERDAIAVFVGYGEVDGVAVVVSWAAVVVDVGCFI